MTRAPGYGPGARESSGHVPMGAAAAVKPVEADGIDRDDPPGHGHAIAVLSGG
jgi:hypothetical protein